MTQLTPATLDKPVFGSITMAAVALILVLAQSSPVQAQWTTPNAQGHINTTNTGSVGIGTATPNKSSVSKALTVNGSTDAIYELAIGDVRKGTMYHDNTNLSFTNNASGALTLGTNNTERFRIDSSGNVGIGTSSPNAKLVVTGGADTSLAIGDRTNNGSIGLQFRGSGYKHAGLRFDGDNLIVENASSSLTPSTWYDANAMNFIVRKGNVGIGTTSPGNMLELFGASPIIRLNNGPSVFQFGLIASGPGHPTLYNLSSANANTIFKISARGTGTPLGGGSFLGGQLHVAGTDSVADSTNYGSYLSLNTFTGAPYEGFPVGINFNSIAAGTGVLGAFSFSFNGAVATTIGTNGSVGIGTTSPGYKLDVNGEINATGLRINGTPISTGGTSQWSNNGTGISYSSGNVGIGATAPAVKLAIGGNGANIYGTDTWIENNVHVQGNETLAQGGRGRMRIGTAWGYVGLYADGSSTAAANDLVLGAGTGIVRVGPGGASVQNFIVPNGSVGIGTAAPNSSYKLDVNGSTNITGNINVTGNIAAKYQDVAEWVESSQALDAGTVVVLDQTKSNQVIASSQAYDTRVAGVVSLQPGITLGEKGSGKLLVATTGRVKIKVDASAGPIQIGDLLVTSDEPGVAKKSEPLNLGGVQIHRPGTLIGKALEPLAIGTGEILVLLSLQ